MTKVLIEYSVRMMTKVLIEYNVRVIQCTYWIQWYCDKKYLLNTVSEWWLKYLLNKMLVWYNVLIE